jgi:hypothetical protein
MTDAPLTEDLIGPAYYADPYYQSAHYAEKLAAAYAMEAARQELQRGEATHASLAYARFLSAVENDATMSHGRFKAFTTTDGEVARAWPFLAEIMLASREVKP